jgi:hypothetical protein
LSFRSPITVFSGCRIDASRRTAFDSSTGPSARNGLSIPSNDSRLRRLRPSVQSRPITSLPGLRFPLLVRCIAPRPFPVRPGESSFNTSDPLQFRSPALIATLPAAAPPRDCYLPRDRRPARFVTNPVRLPNPPDLLSLPATVSIASSGCGSSFQVRYVSGGLLFLKPLGTFFTMRLAA